MRIMRRVAKSIDQWAEEFLCSVLLSILMVILFIQVIYRYVFFRSFAWNEELARFIFIWVVYLGISLGAKYNEHIRVTVFSKVFPQEYRKIVEYIADIGFLGFCVVVFYLGIEMLQTMFHFKHLSAALQWNTAYVYFIIPLSFLLTSLRIIQYHIRKSRSKDLEGMKGI